VNTCNSAIVRYRVPLCFPASLSVTNVPIVVPPQSTMNGPTPGGTLKAWDEHWYRKSPNDVPTHTSKGESHAWYVGVSSRLYTAT